HRPHRRNAERTGTSRIGGMSRKTQISSAIGRLGVVEWLRPGEYQRAEQVLADIQALAITQLRPGVSSADWDTAEGQAWFDWLMPPASESAEPLRCFACAAPALGIYLKSSSPPRGPEPYADFLEVMITEYGQYFQWVELWNEPNALNDSDWRLDANWQI